MCIVPAVAMLTIAAGCAAPARQGVQRGPAPPGQAGASSGETDEAAWDFSEQEDLELFACASEKTGLAITAETMAEEIINDTEDPDGDDDGITTEREWDQQRMHRAYLALRS